MRHLTAEFCAQVAPKSWNRRSEMDDCKQCSDSNARSDSTVGVNLPGNQSIGRRGRRIASQSRAAEIRSKLLAWKQTPELQKISLRALAVELGTSHQLLRSYLRGLNKWQAKDYKCRAEEIRNVAWAENRRLTPWEESRAEALDRTAFQCMIESALTHALRRYEKELREGKCRAGNLKLVRMLAQRGFPDAQKVLQKYKFNLPPKQIGNAKSFRRGRSNAGNPAKMLPHAIA